MYKAPHAHLRITRRHDIAKRSLNEDRTPDIHVTVTAAYGIT